MTSRKAFNFQSKLTVFLAVYLCWQVCNWGMYGYHLQGRPLQGRLDGVDVETKVSFVIMSLSNLTVMGKFVFSVDGTNT